MQVNEHIFVQDTDDAWEHLADSDLLGLVRSGHPDAYAELYGRHRYIAVRLARHLGKADEADDVVSQAFANVLDLLKRGKGPDQHFRGYLLTAVRHESGRRAAARKRVVVTTDETVIDTVVPFGNGKLDEFEASAIRTAYEALPERWRSVLWSLDVEGRKPLEVAEMLGLAPNAVSALVYRARAALREEYLQAHVRSDRERSSTSTCDDIRPKLASSVRETAPKRDREKVFAHLATCGECMKVYLELEEVNVSIGAGGRLKNH